MQREFPLGSIQVYSGAIVDIPGTWRLCDGTLGTPDLRDKFIVGAGDTYAVDGISGAVEHGHDFTSDSHYHTIAAGTNIVGGNYVNITTGDSVSTGTTDNGSILPPYLSLAYIMYAGKVH